MKTNTAADVSFLHRTALVLSTLLLVCGCGQDVPQPDDSGQPTSRAVLPVDEPAEIPTAGDALGLLVDVEDLQKRLGEDNLRIIDARPLATYEAGHVPGAVPVDVDAWKALSLRDGAAGLHDRDGWSKAVGGLAIDKNTNVVVYSSSPTSAARIWWILKFVGVENAGILDGGWSAWQSSGAEVSTEPADAEPTEFKANFQDDRLALIGDLKESHASSGLIVLDARSAAEYTGEGKGKGRIPGASHLEWKELLTEEGRYKPIAELKELFTQHGVAPEKTAVTHCQSGGRASVNIFALELAGFGKVKNYYCGWSEWGSDDQTPRAQGQPK